MDKPIDIKRLIFCSIVAIVLAFTVIPCSAVAVNGEASSFSASAANKQVIIDIKSWNIKSSVTATADLNQLAKTSSLLQVSKKGKYAKKLSDRYFISGQPVSSKFTPTGYGAPLHTKVGTATLNSKAPANMIVKYETITEHKLNTSRISSFLIICYKGSAKADIYADYMVKLYDKGKVVKIDGKKYRLCKAKKFKNGKKYGTVHHVDGKILNKNRIMFLNENPVGKNNYYKLISGGYSQDEWYGMLELSEKTVSTDMWYGNKMTKVNLTITAPTLNKDVTIKVKNKKATGFKKKADKKSRIYKAGNKEMKKKKASAYTETALNIYNNANAGFPMINFPLNELRTGDLIVEPGNDGVFKGSGKQFNGSTTYRKTYISNGPVYGCMYISRTPYAFFRYHKQN